MPGGSAVAVFYAPSDISGTGGMRKERIRAITTWRGGPGKFDTVFVKDFPDARTISSGLTVSRVKAFFSFSFFRVRADHNATCRAFRRARAAKLLF